MTDIPKGPLVKRNGASITVVSADGNYFMATRYPVPGYTSPPIYAKSRSSPFPDEASQFVLFEPGQTQRVGDGTWTADDKILFECSDPGGELMRQYMEAYQ